MATTTATAQETVDSLAKLTYLEWHDHYKTEKPFMALDIPEDAVDKRGGNITFKQGEEEVIHDIRGHEKDFTLDGHGLHHPPPIVNNSFLPFSNEDLVWDKS